jgi:hypothetical protein
MTMVEREPGTYRTRAGTLIHFRRAPDGSTVIDAEVTAYGKPAGAEDLVKLSDDPNWPDLERHLSDPALFAD